MNPESSPFTPNQPVNTDFFTGREVQIKRLADMVQTAGTGRLQTAWIAGERGIGKSSLASFAGFVAERRHNALVAHVHLGGVSGLEEMVRQSYLSLLKDNESKPWGEKLLDIFRDKVKKVGFFGTEIEFSPSGKDLSATVSNFAESLSQIIKKTANDRKALLLILDDINGLADEPKFAHWIKSTVDGAATGGLKVPACLIFVGLRERLDSMKKNNPSVIRCFNEIVEIKSWTETETKDFFGNAFRKKKVSIEDSMLDELAAYSGGLPVFAHEIGYQVWRAARDDKIEEEYLYDGVTEAAYSIGTRFIERDVVQALGSKNYKSILGKISLAFAPGNGDTFSRQQLLSLKTLTGKEKDTLDNFLRRMAKIGGIKSAEKGVYRFPTEMHRVYFFLKALPPKPPSG